MTTITPFSNNAAVYFGLAINKKKTETTLPAQSAPSNAAAKPGFYDAPTGTPFMNGAYHAVHFGESRRERREREDRQRNMSSAQRQADDERTAQQESARRGNSRRQRGRDAREAAGYDPNIVKAYGQYGGELAGRTAEALVWKIADKVDQRYSDDARAERADRNNARRAANERKQQEQREKVQREREERKERANRKQREQQDKVRAAREARRNR